MYGDASDRETCTSIVFSAGGSRGIAHLGVLDEWAEAGIGPSDFAYACGTSAGSLALLLFSSGIETRDIIALVRRELTVAPYIGKWPQVLLFGRLLRGGLERRLRRHLGPDRRLESLTPPLIAVSYDLRWGRCHVHTTGDAINACVASAALPGLCRPVRTADGEWLLDGSIATTLPADVLHQQNSDTQVIGVDVSNHTSTWNVEENSLPSPLQVLSHVWSSQNHRKQLERQQRKLCDVVIRPRVSGIGFCDLSRRVFDELVERGRQAARSALPAVKRLLATNCSGRHQSNNEAAQSLPYLTTCAR